jgi:hypothetical protein
MPGAEALSGKLQRIQRRIGDSDHQHSLVDVNSSYD